MGIVKYNLDSKVYKPANPYKSRLLSSELLSASDSQDQIYHITLDTSDDNFSFIEGQSIGVLPKGLDANKKPHKLRLYSIASSRRGDNGQSTSLSVCVKRVEYLDEAEHKILGVASNAICNWKVGDEIEITGPTGKAFVLPTDPTTNLILIATGTGIAPFRSFLQHIYRDREDWTGRVLLFYGAKRKSELVYANDENSDLEEFTHHKGFQRFYSLSRENYAESGKKIYVQDIVKNNEKDVWSLLSSGNYSIYICGLKGMEKGIQDSFRSIFKQHNESWDDGFLQLKKDGRWNQEVY